MSLWKPMYIRKIESYRSAAACTGREKTNKNKLNFVKLSGALGLLGRMIEQFWEDYKLRMAGELSEENQQHRRNGRCFFRKEIHEMQNVYDRFYSQANTDSLEGTILFVYLCVCFVATAADIWSGYRAGETSYSCFGSDHFSFVYGLN